MPKLTETLARLRECHERECGRGLHPGSVHASLDLLLPEEVPALLQRSQEKDKLLLDAAEEVEKLQADKERLLEECRDKRAWLQWKLETAIVHVPAEYDLGRKTSDGWGAVCIPDWDVKQKIQSLNETISESLQTHGRVPGSTAEAKQETSPARKEKAE